MQAGAAPSPSAAGPRARAHRLPALVLTAVEAEAKAARERVIIASPAVGAAAVVGKMQAEASTKRLTYNEKKDAVGEWMFGEGGIRALA